MAAEAGQVWGLTAVAGLAFGSLAPTLGVSTMQSLAFLESATAAGVSVVALLSVLVARMSGDRQLLTVGRTWAFYALVVMPLTAVSDAGAAPSPWSAASAASTAVFLALFAHAAWGFPMRWSLGRRLVWPGLLGLTLAILAAVQLPVAALGPVALDSADLIFVAGWALLALRCVTRGLRRGQPVWWRTGFGLGIIAAGQLLAVLNGAGAAGGMRVLQFPALRLLGVLVLMAGLIRYTRRLVRDRRDRDAERAEQAAVTAHAQDQRSHEIRNVLSNLSAITTVLARSDHDRRERPAGSDHDVPAADPGSINEIISSEFARLHSLLESSSAGHDSAGAPVDRVLTRLVTLRRLTGSVITLSCPPGLLAALPAATLAQVVTNLLANCARHAPGAEIHVSARSTDGVCIIEVTDAGPGLLALQGETATTGSGLGLELSSQLVGDCGGTLQLLPATRFPSGTTARLCLPLVDGVDAGRPTAVNDRDADLQVASS
jgi:two-component system OmpR family sensor kinase